MEKNKKIIVGLIILFAFGLIALFVFSYQKKNKTEIQTIQNQETSQEQKNGDIGLAENISSQKNIFQDEINVDASTSTDAMKIKGKIGKINSDSLECSSKNINNFETFNIKIPSIGASIFKRKSLNNENSFSLEKIELNSVPLNEEVEMEIIYNDAGDFFELRKLVVL